MTIGRGFSLLISLLTILLSCDSLTQAFCWLAFISKLAARDIWFGQLRLICFFPTSAGGGKPTHNKYLEDIIIGLSFYLHWASFVWTQKSCVIQEQEEPRQTDWAWGNSKGEQRVLHCVLVWLWGSKCWFIPWTGTACVSAKRVWNIWATPVGWFAFLIRCFPAIQLCKKCRPYYSVYGHQGCFGVVGAMLCFKLEHSYWMLIGILKGICIFVNVHISTKPNLCRSTSIKGSWDDPKIVLYSKIYHPPSSMRGNHLTLNTYY